MKRLIFVTVVLVLVGVWFPLRANTKVHPHVRLAAFSCTHVKKGQKIDRQMLHKLLQIERDLGVPERYRGMLLAKACIETGFNPDKKGDCWGKGGYCYARGMFQFWPWATKFGLDRTNPVASGKFLLERIKLGSRTKVRKFCPHIKGRDAKWRVAWVRVNRGPYYKAKDGTVKHRCHGVPHGLAQLRKWQRSRKWRVARKVRLARLDRRRRKSVHRHPRRSYCGKQGICAEAM